MSNFEKSKTGVGPKCFGSFPIRKTAQYYVFVNHQKKFIRELTLIGVVLTALVAVVYHIFIPERYFLWFPAIPIFFYLFGLFYIEMFSFYYRMGLENW